MKFITIHEAVSTINICANKINIVNQLIRSKNKKPYGLGINFEKGLEEICNEVSESLMNTCNLLLSGDKK